jgi:Tol biopolymer transport system component
LLKIDAASGSATEMSPKWPQIGKVLAAAAGGDLYVTADPGSGLFNIFRASVDGARLTKIGDDLSDYKNISISADAKFLVAVKSDKVANFFTARPDFTEATQFAQTGAGTLGGPSYLPDGKIIFVSTERGNRDIWQMSADGRTREPITFEDGDDDHPSVSAGRGLVVYVSTRGGVSHVWRMDVSGQNKAQLTDQGGESFPQITRDGKWVIYSSKFEGHFALWKVSADGGDPVRVSDVEANWPAISPDGRSIACLARIATKEGGPDKEKEVKLAVLSADDGRILKLLDADKVQMSPEFPPVIRWSPDGRAVTYVSTSNGVSNIWSQPLTGGAPRRLSDFSTDRIFSYDWSSDEKQVLYSRGSIRNDIVLFQDL